MHAYFPHTTNIISASYIILKIIRPFRRVSQNTLPGSHSIPFNRNNWGGCDRVSNCEVEKQGIIDSAKTQYLIETTGRQTQEYLGNKIDFYEYQNLRDQLAAERSKNMVLENRLYSDAQFTALSRQLEGCCCANERRLDAIECQMLKRPAIYGIGATCSGQIIPPITTTTTP